ncbi:class I SAM-dependent methyltransferase [Marivirga sp. S37H4]|uniref:Class I SAM-dependent methyltransferase n=1 Tax=Marivirga aurantiaca TaxID=2802615 RepID=A0A934WY29_9BACT|nr:class I SAM-dependent methyltransferase [Marivirga aurantiaca]MBK6265022.1 class I SAM-dependent methyltransferase [Marivirga aurantiaca]
MVDESKKEWFNEWFDSPYYHILYKDRDEAEARNFIKNLTSFLSIQKNDSVLDVACGKGRHSIYLNQLGFKVDGIDLSKQNIEIAKLSENENLHFEVHDMRHPYRKSHFDFAFNMFTSFGYFEIEQDNQRAISAIADALKSNGIFVLDFLNPYKVINNLVTEEIKEVEGIEFHINRSFDGEHIIKDIAFTDSGKLFHFQEKVKAIRRLSFLDYFRNANLMPLETFGDYSLNEYQPEISNRMIFIAKKL